MTTADLITCKNCGSDKKTRTYRVDALTLSVHCAGCGEYYELNVLTTEASMEEIVEAEMSAQTRA